MQSKFWILPECSSVSMGGVWRGAHGSGAPNPFFYLSIALSKKRNLDPYGEMSRPAVRKVETTDGSSSPSLSWTFLNALATIARSPFNSFAMSKILSELFNTSTVWVYGLYLLIFIVKVLVAHRRQMFIQQPDAEGPFDVVCNSPDKFCCAIQWISIEVLLLVGGHLN